MKLALDAGHWIGEPGRRCLKQFDPQEHREWWLNDRIARYVAERAAEYDGFRVLRVDDVTGKTEVSLANRCKKANEWGADFFLSIHHNGGINGGSGGGIVAYSYPNSTAGAEWRDVLYQYLVDATALRGNRANPKTTANYAVLRQTNMPAVLIEHGFMDSSFDIPIIIDEAFAKACGYAEADCIAHRFGLKHKQKEIIDIKEDDDMTQDKFNEMLKTALGISGTGDTPSAWAKEACEQAKADGVFAGDGKGSFGWQTPVTREQIAVLLSKWK